jgi:dTMP kinase
MSKPRGAFILFEGLDRCGKSTQSSMLSNILSLSMAVEAIRFPDRTSNIGQLINSYLSSASDLNDQTIHLLFSANRWEASKSIENKLASGITLVSYIQHIDKSYI